MYKTLVKPALMYGCETWTLSQSDIIELGWFERVRCFVYIGSLINENDDIKAEINRRIQASNKCYYGLQSMGGSSGDVSEEHVT